MRIAFYAPLKSPMHGTPSGDRRIAGLFMDALERAGHRVALASDFRSYEPDGDGQRQDALRAEGVACGRKLVEQWRNGPAAARPELWFTYHSYYKAPDWLGPEASTLLAIPYVLAEASHAGKRAGGAWDTGHRGAMDSIRRADLLLCPTRDDVEGLRAVAASPERIASLPPFLDPAPFRAAAGARGACRNSLACAHGLDPSVPWIVVAAMMRHGDKLASYRALALALGSLRDLPWCLLVAGDGPARADVENLFAAAIPDRVTFLGVLSLPEVAAAYAAADLCAWPAVNEAYGMALLEAQAAGVPVVSCATRGVPDVVEHGKTGLLATAGDEAGFAGLVRELLLDKDRRARMSAAAVNFAAGDRGIASAAVRLGNLLARFAATPA
jgi:glycosyltransferase involved in cell wall biosynthesis